MGRLQRLLLPVFLIFSAVQAREQTLLIEDVNSRISDYLEAVQNGTLVARDSDTARNFSGCLLACNYLNFVKPDRVSYAGSVGYRFETSRYWSAQQATASPTCRFSPLTALDVSLAVLTVQVSNCKFAVKSGGHAAFAGASNINSGLTIDLVNMNQIEVSSDRTQTSIGPGNRWADVYSILEKESLAVIGGRVSDIGVGGLTLGGGISFFSSRYGMACDNVNTFEVVLADGSIREVSLSQYPDLFYALRGGGNNFGIVTRFDMATFQQGDLWGGGETFAYSTSTATTLNNAFYDFNINSPSDPYAQIILAYSYFQAMDIYVISSDVQYGKPVESPPILKNFTTIPGAIIPHTRRITPLTGLTNEFNNSNPGGFRQTYWVFMAKNSATLMADILAIYMEETNAVKNAANVTASCVFQPLPISTTSHFQRNGGNSLGLSPADGPLNLINIVFSWMSIEDDKRILAAARNIVNRANQTAYDRGLGHPFLYQNYAAKEQDVFASYGKNNLEKLRRVSKKYDPKGVWWKLQPGYFKIF